MRHPAHGRERPVRGRALRPGRTVFSEAFELKSYSSEWMNMDGCVCGVCEWMDSWKDGGRDGGSEAGVRTVSNYGPSSFSLGLV